MATKTVTFDRVSVLIAAIANGRNGSGATLTFAPLSPTPASLSQAELLALIPNGQDRMRLRAEARALMIAAGDLDGLWQDTLVCGPENAAGGEWWPNPASPAVMQSWLGGNQPPLFTALAGARP